MENGNENPAGVKSAKLVGPINSEFRAPVEAMELARIPVNDPNQKYVTLRVEHKGAYEQSNGSK